jgi:hypothetical protein
MASTIGAGPVGDDRLGRKVLLSEKFAHLRVPLTMPKPRTRPLLRPGTRPFFAPLTALIANARRFSPESARQIRLSTHYLGTEDRYFNFLRHARE